LPNEKFTYNFDLKKASSLKLITAHLALVLRSRNLPTECILEKLEV